MNDSMINSGETWLPIVNSDKNIVDETTALTADGDKSGDS